MFMRRFVSIRVVSLWKVTSLFRVYTAVFRHTHTCMVLLGPQAVSITTTKFYLSTERPVFIWIRIRTALRCQSSVARIHVNPFRIIIMILSFYTCCYWHLYMLRAEQNGEKRKIKQLNAHSCRHNGCHVYA